MNIRMIILTALFGFTGMIQAQSPSTSDPTRSPGDMGVARANATVATADQSIDQRSAEVLNDPTVNRSTSSVDLQAVDQPMLPRSVASSDIAVGEVYLDVSEDSLETSMEMANDTISVDFPDEDVRSIIRSVSDLYELNVVIPDTLVGSVSLKLRDVSWRQVFDVVLEPLNFTWIEDGNIIKIKSVDDLLAEPVATRVYVINYATAGEIQGSIKPMVDAAAGGRIQVDVRSNALVVTERPSRMNDIQAIIDRLDRPTDQVMIESKFVEVTTRDEQNLGINWSALNGYEVSAGPFNQEYTRDDQVDNITSTIGGAVSNSVISTIGTNRLDTAFFDAAQFGVVLSALENNNDVKLVSNPTVVTMNNTVAQISIGEEYPIPEYRFNDQTGTFEVSGFTYKPIGIMLNVVPQVNSAGFINLAIKPEISSRTGEVIFGGTATGASIPIITTRKTESNVTVKSGYTLAIGGLLQTETGNTENKVPVLGDIPFLGRLFRSNTDSVEGRNLIIFITAKVLNPDGSTYEDVFNERTLNEMGVNPRDIPGFTPPPAEQALYERLRAEKERLEQLRSETELKQQLIVVDELQQAAERSEEKRAQSKRK